MTDLEKRPNASADLARALEALQGAKSPGTRRAYAAAWDDWQRYRAATGLSEELPVPVGALLAWLSHCRDRGLGLSALQSRISAVKAIHDHLQLTSPTADPRVGLFMQAAGAGKGATRQKKAITAEMLVQMLEHITEPRDRAILLVGYISALRRGELAALRWSDVTFEDDAAVLYIRRSKTDQAGTGRYVGLPVNQDPDLCPVQALQNIREESSPEARVFGCSAKTILRVVKKAVAAIGLNPQEYGAHSLRRGMITDARRAGIPNSEIMHQSGHVSEAQLATYTQARDAAQNKAAVAAVRKLRKP